MKQEILKEWRGQCSYIGDAPERPATRSLFNLIDLAQSEQRSVDKQIALDHLDPKYQAGFDRLGSCFYDLAAKDIAEAIENQGTEQSDRAGVEN